jgi:hypothetical protein
MRQFEEKECVSFSYREFVPDSRRRQDLGSTLWYVSRRTNTQNNHTDNHTVTQTQRQTWQLEASSFLSMTRTARYNTGAVNTMATLTRYNKPGGWADPDLLIGP